jgi:hypothetical protein
VIEVLLIDFNYEVTNLTQPFAESVHALELVHLQLPLSFRCRWLILDLSVAAAPGFPGADGFAF